MVVTGYLRMGVCMNMRREIFLGMEGKNIIPGYNAAGYGFQ